MQYLIVSENDPVLHRRLRRRRLVLKKKTDRPVIENFTWPETHMDRIPQEVMALCAQLRELVRLENQGRKRTRPAEDEDAKTGATRVFRQMTKRGDSIHDLARRLSWSQDRAVRLVAGEEVPGFFEIPAIAAAIDLPVTALLVAYGYPKDTFQSAESLAQAVLIEAERT